MSADTSHIDSVLQFALLTAGEADDFPERQLGPIHLIKYVYLADLAFAKRHEGNSYTGVNWQFYHFGPWAGVVNDRIEPALLAIGAERMAFPSDYGDNAEWVRWTLRRDDLINSLEKSLPPGIVLAVRSFVRRFGKDTPSLLAFVYRTEPMIRAAPQEYLDLRHIAQIPMAQPDDSDVPGPSVKKLKRFEARLDEARKKYAASSGSAAKLINPAPTQRFDEIFQSGVDWLDALAGEPVSTSEVVAEFAPDVWKSATRSEHDPS